MDMPSAQSVGREFVRQYYTMLHEAPDFLHRFYSHNSSFVHGGIEKPGEEQAPAIGQSEIHKKITSLEFQDCHAKIRQVDSQASIEGAVVIQVVGELSNAGSPMRRFMQTFVLAPQSPKKYYLHNDIFRYQDEVFHDTSATDVDGTATSDEINEYSSADPEEVHHVQQQLLQQQLLQQQQQLHHVPTAEQERTAVSGGYYDHADGQVSVPSAVSNGKESYEEILSANTGAMTIGGGQPENVKPPQVSEDHPVPVDLTSATAPQDAGGVASVDEGGMSSDAAVKVSTEQKVEEMENVDEGTRANETSVNVSAATETPAQPVSAGPAQKPTWAAMASRNMLGNFAAKPQATIRPEPNASGEQRTPVSNGAGGLPQRTSHRTGGSADTYTGGRDGSTAGGPTTARGEGTARPAGMENGSGGRSGFDGGRGGDSGDENGRRFQQQQQLPVYPDSQQVFVGNVPQHVTDLELKEYFEQYGTVVDIRINRKPSNNLPYFGFITYDSSAAVQKILSSRPLLKLHGKHRLNVEEKKPKEELGAIRPRSSGGPRASLPGGSKPPGSYSGGRDSYISSGGGRSQRGGYNNGGGGEESQQNGNYHGGNHPAPGVTRSYTGSCSSDDGRGPTVTALSTSAVATTAASSQSGQH